MIYLDNAATTAISEEVKAAIIESLDNFGNASSTHGLGRKAKVVIEQVRKNIAATLHCLPGEIFFTSGGSEANNLAILSAVRDLGVKHIITSAIEHHAVLHPVEFLQETRATKTTFLPVDENGDISLNDLETALQNDEKALVSLMYCNNEIGNINPVFEIAALCKKYNALFHTDAVQAVAHLPIDLQTLQVDFLSSSAHKFHGPKGIGFCFIRGGLKIKPQLMGGAQERNMRAGTENMIGIVGLGKAFELAYATLTEDKKHMESLKNYAINQLNQNFEDLTFFGQSGNLDKSLFTVLNIGIPNDAQTGMLTFSLDMHGVAASGGSACNSGSNAGSHVIRALGPKFNNYVPLRISFCKHNTFADVDGLIEALKKIRKPILQHS